MKVVALERLMHNGAHIEKGEVVDLPESTVAELGGAVTPAAAGAKTKVGKNAEKGSESTPEPSEADPSQTNEQSETTAKEGDK